MQDPGTGIVQQIVHAPWMPTLADAYDVRHPSNDASNGEKLDFYSKLVNDWVRDWVDRSTSKLAVFVWLPRISERKVASDRKWAILDAAAYLAESLGASREQVRKIRHTVKQVGHVSIAWQHEDEICYRSFWPSIDHGASGPNRSWHTPLADLVFEMQLPDEVRINLDRGSNAQFEGRAIHGWNTGAMLKHADRVAETQIFELRGSEQCNCSTTVLDLLDAGAIVRGLKSVGESKRERQRARRRGRLTPNYVNNSLKAGWHARLSNRFKPMEMAKAAVPRSKFKQFIW